MNVSIVGGVGNRCRGKTGITRIPHSFDIDFGTLGEELDRYHRLTELVGTIRGRLVPVVTVVTAGVVDRPVRWRGASSSAEGQVSP